MTGTGKLRLAFSTLGCPEWDAATVVDQAAAGGWDGVEWRGGPEGTVRSAWPADRRRELRQAMGEAGLVSVAVTTYSNLVSGDAALVRASLDDTVAHAELASEIAAPAIRVFLGEPDDDASPSVLERRAIDALRELLARVHTLGINVAIEPHDDHVRADTIGPILDALPDPALGVVWDVANAWSAGEDPASGLAIYRGRVTWVQVKDGTGAGPTWRLSDLGAGEVPIDDALGALVRACVEDGGAIPPISLEWERAWHAHLDPAGVALPRAHAWLVDHVGRAIESGVR